MFATSAFAVDGQVLINQSTVMAAGGFPYIISNSGSYKLSGNLTMNTTSAGNYLDHPITNFDRNTEAIYIFKLGR